MSTIPTRYEPAISVQVRPEGSPEARVDLSHLVTQLEYEDAEHVADKLKLTIDNWDLANFDDPVWRKGNHVFASWGYPGDMAPVRECRIQKVTGFTMLTVEAHGLEVAANVEVRNRIFENMSRSDVARRIAAELGYSSPEVVHIEETRVVYEHIAQARLTDSQFLRRLAAKEGFEWFVDFDGFHFHRRKLAQRPIKVFRWYDDPDKGEIISITVENDVTRAGTVRYAGRDPLARRTIDVKTDHESATDRPVLGHVVEAPSAGTGVPGFKSIGHSLTRSTIETSEAAAKRQADGKFLKHQQIAVKMRLECPGDPNLLGKSVVEVQNVGKRLSQKYYVRTVTHIVGRDYRSRLELLSDGSGGHSTKSKLAKELSAINVGPPVVGKRGPDFARRTIDAAEPLTTVRTTDAEGKPVIKHVDSRSRGTNG